MTEIPEHLLRRARERRNEAKTSAEIPEHLLRRAREARNKAKTSADSKLYKENGDRYAAIGLSEQAISCYQRAIELDSKNAEYLITLGGILFKLGRVQEAERLFLQALTCSNTSETLSSSYNWLGIICFSESRWLSAETMFSESFRLNPDATALKNLSLSLEKMGRFEESSIALQQAIYLFPNSPDSKHSLNVIGSNLTDNETSSFDDFLELGDAWLKGALWTEPHSSSLLRTIHSNGTTWASLSDRLFVEFDVDDEYLDESRARIESLSEHLHLEVEYPIWLKTPTLSIAMTIENGQLRAFVASGTVGVAVSLDLRHWDLHFLKSDPDAAFAAGVVLNFFIDCSMNLDKHVRFAEDRNTNQGWGPEGNAWITTTQFDRDIDDIRTGRVKTPPRAHRVKGFTRKLKNGKPSEDARSNAPSYIRRHLAPDETFVRPHRRGGEGATESLLNHIKESSSLADFIATAPRL